MHFFVLIINFLQIRISTDVVVKVYNPQRTLDLDQTLWPTTFQKLGMRQDKKAKMGNLDSIDLEPYLCMRFPWPPSYIDETPTVVERLLFMAI